jgi:hypothetical protein
MRIKSFITVTALAVALCVAVIPTAAMAKPKIQAKALTKSQVISLIKQYSKAGKTGPTGPAGSNGTDGTNGTNGTDGVTPTFTLAQNSGLQIGSGNALSLLPSLTQPCAYHQALYYLDPIGNGEAWCSFPVQGQFTTGGFDTTVDPDPQTSLTNTAATIASETVNYASGTNKYLVNAVVELSSLNSELAVCQLVNETTNTVYEEEDDTVDGYANLSFLDTPSIPSSDVLGIKCAGTQTTAEATLSVIPLG